MVGVQLGNSNDEQAAPVTDQVLEAMKDRGNLLGKTGLNRNVLTLMPPLIISDEQLARACDELQQTLQDLVI